jgi:hypothetical protein
MKNFVIAGALLLVGACATPVFAQNQAVSIQTFTALHEAPITIGGIPIDPETGGDDGAQFATRKDKVTIHATFTNGLPGYTGKYRLTSGSTVPDADGDLNINSVLRFDHKGKAGTKTYSLSVWIEYGTTSIGLKSQNAICG